MAMIETRNGFSQSLGTTTIGTQFPKVNVDNFHYAGETSIGSFNYSGDNVEYSSLLEEVQAKKIELQGFVEEYDRLVSKVERLTALVKQLKDNPQSGFAFPSWYRQLEDAKSNLQNAQIQLQTATNNKTTCELELLELKGRLELLAIELEGQEATEQNQEELATVLAELSELEAQQKAEVVIHNYKQNTIESIENNTTDNLIKPKQDKYLVAGVIVAIVLGLALIFKKK